jgi:hypothetical protein
MHLVKTICPIFFLFFFFFGCAGVWTQGFVFARWTLYHLNNIPILFALVIFPWDRVSCFCPGQALVLLCMSSQVAGMVGMFNNTGLINWDGLYKLFAWTGLKLQSFLTFASQVVGITATWCEPLHLASCIKFWSFPRLVICGMILGSHSKA